MIYTVFMVMLNILLTTTMTWLVADMFILGWSYWQSMAITALYIVIFGGVVGSMRDYRELAERRMLFNIFALCCVLVAYMLSG